jgi:hypothetical protein
MDNILLQNTYPSTGLAGKEKKLLQNTYGSTLGRESRLSKIRSLGGDQPSNQFAIYFLGIPGTSLDLNNIPLRIDQAFDVPAYTVGEHEFMFMGNKIVRPSKVEETDKHISLQIRIDQNWELVDALIYWRKMFYNPDTGKGKAMSGDYGKNMNTTVRVVSYNRGDISNVGGTPIENEMAFITFHYVLPKEIQISSFDPSSNDPQRMTLNLIYGQVTYDFKHLSLPAKVRNMADETSSSFTTTASF